MDGVGRAQGTKDLVKDGEEETLSAVGDPEEGLVLINAADAETSASCPLVPVQAALLHPLPMALN